MGSASEARQRAQTSKVATSPSESATLEPIHQEKQDHQNESREQLITELETIEQRLTTQTDELRQTILQLASAEQRERDRLAAILHDDLQQLLMAAKWALRSLRKQCRGDRALSQELSQAIRMVERSIQMSRSLSRDLSPPALESGLMPAIDRLSEHFREAYGFRVMVKVEGAFTDIDDSLRDFLFQAIRELLLNAAKHSNQEKAELCLREGKSAIEVIISDEGAGFDLKDLDSILAKGTGLLRVWTRVTRVGGQLRVETSPGGGSTFRLSVPRSDNE